MKMLCDYQGIDLIKTETNSDLKKLHTAAESLVLAMRYVGIQIRDEEKLETVLRKIAFLDEIRREIKEAASRGDCRSLPQWALELSIVSESGELEEIHDFLDSLFRCFAEACVWLNEIEESEAGNDLQRFKLKDTFQHLVDFVACGSLAIVSGSGKGLDRRAA